MVTLLVLHRSSEGKTLLLGWIMLINQGSGCTTLSLCCLKPWCKCTQTLATSVCPGRLVKRVSFTLWLSVPFQEPACFSVFSEGHQRGKDLACHVTLIDTLRSYPYCGLFPSLCYSNTFLVSSFVRYNWPNILVSSDHTMISYLYVLWNDHYRKVSLTSHHT